MSFTPMPPSQCADIERRESRRFAAEPQDLTDFGGLVQLDERPVSQRYNLTAIDRAREAIQDGQRAEYILRGVRKTIAGSTLGADAHIACLEFEIRKLCHEIAILVEDPAAPVPVFDEESGL